MDKFDRLLWLLPAAFVAHVAEEAPGFTNWARRNAREDYTQRDFIRNDVAGTDHPRRTSRAVDHAPRRDDVAPCRGRDPGSRRAPSSLRSSMRRRPQALGGRGGAAVLAEALLTCSPSVTWSSTSSKA